MYTFVQAVSNGDSRNAQKIDCLRIFLVFAHNTRMSQSSNAPNTSTTPPAPRCAICFDLFPTVNGHVDADATDVCMCIRCKIVTHEGCFIQWLRKKNISWCECIQCQQVGTVCNI